MMIKWLIRNDSDPPALWFVQGLCGLCGHTPPHGWLGLANVRTEALEDT